MRTNPSRMIGGALAATLLFAACSSDDSSADVETAEEETGAEATAEPDADTEVAEPEPDTETEVAEPEPEAEPESEAEAGTVDAATEGAAGAVGDSTASTIVASSYLDSYELADEAFGTMTTVTVADGVRAIESNSLPNHETGEFPNAGNPNEISEQSLSFEFTTTPEYAGGQSFAQTPGVSVNGVTFEPGTAETATCESGETYRVEALQDLVNLGLDMNNAHVQPGGQYHYHGVSELMVDAFDSGEDLVHVGFAADGFLIYYSISGAYDSGYALSTDARTGSDCLISGPDGTIVQLDGTAPDGTYTSDWSWSAENGDLDACNGVEIDGEYAYLLTDEFPYIGRCLNGADVSGQPGPGGEAPAGGEDASGAPAGAPDFAAAAESLGVTEDELRAAVPGPGTDLDAAAATLGVDAEDLQAALAP